MIKLDNEINSFIERCCNSPKDPLTEKGIEWTKQELNKLFIIVRKEMKLDARKILKILTKYER